MNYNEIEALVAKAKFGNTKAKETLIIEFTPFIINLAKKSFINSYEYEDVKSECFKALFKSVNNYNPDKHRFVAYATNAIKNSVNNLIRISKRRSSLDGPSTLIYDEKIENFLYDEYSNPEDLVSKKFNIAILNNALNTLKDSEKVIMEEIFLKGSTAKNYSNEINTPYSSLNYNKNRILEKLKSKIQCNVDKKYLN